MAILFGHKKQGKSQLLFFLMKLLQGLGEPVVYVDKSIIPHGSDSAVSDLQRKQWCVNLWQSEIEGLFEGGATESSLKAKLDMFAGSGEINHFQSFFKQLELVADGRRVWLLVDEVGRFMQYEKKTNNVLITFPAEQDRTPFHWITTGSIGMGEFVSGRRRRDFVWDLPVFSWAESLEFAQKLAAAFGLDGPLDTAETSGARTSDPVMVG